MYVLWLRHTIQMQHIVTIFINIILYSLISTVIKRNELNDWLQINWDAHINYVYKIRLWVFDWCQQNIHLEYTFSVLIKIWLAIFIIIFAFCAYLLKWTKIKLKMIVNVREELRIRNIRIYYLFIVFKLAYWTNICSKYLPLIIFLLIQFFSFLNIPIFPAVINIEFLNKYIWIKKIANK